MISIACRLGYVQQAQDQPHVGARPQFSAESFVAWLASYKACVLAAFALLFLGGTALVPLSLKQMTTDVPAASGSYSEHANHIANTHFPGKVNEHVVAVLVSRWDDRHVLGPDRRGQLLSWLTEHLAKQTASLKEQEVVKRMDSWSHYATTPSLSASFVSSDGKVSLIAVRYHAKNTQRVLNAVRDALNSVPQALASELRILLTGLAPINQASIDGVIENLQEMDSIAFPIALMLLGVALCSWRLMILPVVSILSAATLSFGVMMSALTAIYPIFILAGSMMMSLLIAMSVDYSLFVLGRFQAEVTAAPPDIDPTTTAQASLSRTLATAGHTVLVSGSTLVLCFLGLVLTRENFMTSMGAGCAMAIVSSMITSLVLTPALILQFPRFFTGEGCRTRDHNNVEENVTELSLKESLQVVPAVTAEGGNMQTILEAQQLAKTRWFRLASCILTFKWPICLLLLGACAWPLARLPHMELSRSPLFCVPFGNEAFVGFSQALEHFGAGLLWPTKVLVLAPPGSSILASDSFNRVAQSVENARMKVPQSPGWAVESLVYYNDSRVPASVMEVAQNACAGGSAYRVAKKIYGDELDLLCMARHDLLNEDESAMVINLELKGDPFSREGGEWLLALRTAFPQHDPERYFVVSNPSSVLDTMSNIYSSAPQVLLLTVVTVFGVVAWSFKSVVVPLRLLPSMALTICWTYGMSVVVYQDGLLAWTGVSSLSPPSGGVAVGVAWVLPALCFTILTGLCLDYDIFVLSRVEEFRLAGFSDHDSVILGVSSTGQTITVAGCIMLTAFSGLLLSKQLMLNQLSFFLIFCVLLDTFVVRTVLVPICMDVLGGCSNWWPRKMPPVTQDVDKR